MHRINRTRRNPAGARKAAAVVAALLLIGLGLAACGSSGSSTTTNTSTSATAATTTGSSPSPGTTPGGPTGPTGSRSGRFTALRECLQKNGVPLPKRTPGQPLAGGLRGVTGGQLAAALRKCGAGGFGSGAVGRFNNPPVAGRNRALSGFAACMRSHGVNLPEPNTSGSGPIFNTKGLDTSSAQFRAAEASCREVLRAAVHAPGEGATR